VTHRAFDRSARAAGWAASAGAFRIGVVASLAVSQPLFDLLGRAPDFLLAHDLRPAEILILTLVLALLVPCGAAALVWLAGRLHRPTALVLELGLLLCFTAVMALLAVKNWEAVGAWARIGLSVGAAVIGTAAYWRVAGVRQAVAWLAPGIVLFPAIFLLRPGVTTLVWPGEILEAAPSTATAPVVMIVFDSLPLTALVDERRRVDRDWFPAFAALAETSTWYRNATTVADYTRWALPALVTGRYPIRATLPMAADHPESLFTLLSSSHLLKVHEPITRLCPATTCVHDEEPVAGKVLDFASTMSVVYLHAVLPEEFESQLPEVDQGWADGLPPVSPQELWIAEGEEGRRNALVDFVDSIDGTDPQPAFYFVHALLPHTPIAYLPTGQRFNTERFLPGLLERRDRWVEDGWAVDQGYRLFLLQVGYADAILGRLVERLKAADLYDQALVVVTSDHGASFRAGLPFRRVSDGNFMDVVPVPLFVKRPFQDGGVISDQNVETVDVVPMMAEILGISVPWRMDGAPAEHSARRAKTVYHQDATQVRTFGSSLLDSVYASVGRKLALFGPTASLYAPPRSSPQHWLIGRKVADVRTTEEAPAATFQLTAQGDFRDVDLSAPFVPVYLAGRAQWTNRTDPVTLAVAVNGIIRATTRTYQFDRGGLRDTWTVVLGLDALRTGANEVEIFVVDDGGRPIVLRRVHRSAPAAP
jgi:hypothetical protein